jgi:hypothetical protein
LAAKARGYAQKKKRERRELLNLVQVKSTKMLWQSQLRQYKERQRVLQSAITMKLIEFIEKLLKNRKLTLSTVIQRKT